MQHTETITINRPQSEVWPLVGDPAAWPKWDQAIEDVVVDGPVREGAKLSYKWRGRTVNATVSRYIRPQTLAIRSDDKGYEFDELISLRGLGNMTMVSITMGFKPAAWWGSTLAVLSWPAKKVTLGRPLRKELNALRAEVEAPEPARQEA